MTIQQLIDAYQEYGDPAISKTVATAREEKRVAEEKLKWYNQIKIEHGVLLIGGLLAIYFFNKKVKP